MRTTTANVMRLLERQGVTDVPRSLVERYVNLINDTNAEIPAFVLSTLLHAARTVVVSPDTPIGKKSLEVITLIETAYGLVPAPAEEQAEAKEKLREWIEEESAPRERE